MVSVGAQAPDFTLKGIFQGRVSDYSLRSYRGEWLVLFFYPADFTFHMSHRGGYTAGGKKAGKRLYNNYDLNHERLFAVCETLKGDFLITYDNAEEVKRMARRHRFQMRLIPMTNTHHATMEELVVGKDLSWMDSFPAVHEPEAEYMARDRKKKCPHKKENRQRRGA